MNRRNGTIILLIVVIVASLILPQVVSDSYTRRLLNLAGIYCIAVLGLNVIMGWGGQISFAHAGLWGVGAYTSALLATRLGVSFWLGMIVSAVTAGLIGLLIGIPTLKLKGHYLAMATIGFGEIIRLALINLEWLTGGAQGVKNIPSVSLGPIGFTDENVYFYLIFVFLVVAIAVAYRIQNSTYGRVLMAIRDSEVAAEVMGLNATFYKVMAFVLSAMFAGVAGSLYAHLTGYISPDTYSFEQMVIFVAMLMIGGMGSIPGVIVGAILMTFLPEWLRPLKDMYLMIYGIGIVLIVAFMPYGIAGLLKRFEPKLWALIPGQGGSAAAATAGVVPQPTVGQGESPRPGVGS